MARIILCCAQVMDSFDVQHNPTVFAQADLLAMIEPRTGPLCDLRLRLVDERGAFDWTATLVATGQAITGTRTMTLVTDGVSIWAEVEEIVVLGRGVIRRMRSSSTTSWAEIIGGSGATVDTGGGGVT